MGGHLRVSTPIPEDGIFIPTIRTQDDTSLPGCSVGESPAQASQAGMQTPRHTSQCESEGSLSIILTTLLSCTQQTRRVKPDLSLLDQTSHFCSFQGFLSQRGSRSSITHSSEGRLSGGLSAPQITSFPSWPLHTAWVYRLCSGLTTSTFRDKPTPKKHSNRLPVTMRLFRTAVTLLISKGAKPQNGQHLPEVIATYEDVGIIKLLSGEMAAAPWCLLSLYKGETWQSYAERVTEAQRWKAAARSGLAFGVDKAAGVTASIGDPYLVFCSTGWRRGRARFVLVGGC